MKLKLHLLGIFFVLITVNSVFGQGGHNLSYKALSSDYQYPIDKNNEVRYGGNHGIVSGVEIGYFKSLSNSFDLGVPFRHGSILYPLSDTDAKLYKEQSFTSLGVSGRLRIDNGKILPIDALLSPFLLAGVEGNYYGRQDPALQFNFPVGAGLNFRLAEGFNIQAQSEYHFGATKFLVHSVGLFFEFDRSASPEKPKVEVEIPVVKKPVVVTPTDTDGDGIEDSKDGCPKVAGLAKFNGCPDTDGDGIEDSKDACPNVAGIAKFNGCADTDGDGVEDSKDACPKIAGTVNGCPDMDGDGIEDSKDACPNVAGIAKFNGCADTDGDGVEDSKDGCPKIAGTINGCPDKDGDGIADNVDKCPSTAGVEENGGCPLIKEETKKVLEFAKQGVEFNTGKNVIKTSSYAIMDNIAKIMTENPAYNLRISGYTDSQGGEDNNLTLSQRRAKACYDYLVKKGVSSARMNHNGFGEASPIATNDTAAGRSKNRRVEFDIYFSGE